MLEKLEELLKNEEFAAKLLALDDDKDVQEMLNDNGIEMTLEEIAAVKKGVIAELNGEEAELSEDDLECVAGGVSVGAVVKVVGGVIKGIVALGNLVHKKTRGRW